MPEFRLASNEGQAGWGSEGKFPESASDVCVWLWVGWGGCVCSGRVLLAASVFVFGGPLGLTCMGLHVLQKVAVELKLDPTGAARVGFWGDRWACDRWQILRHPDIGLQAALKVEIQVHSWGPGPSLSTGLPLSWRQKG